ncbi:GNAT family N-acetyltransferase [Roseovarius sp. 217]|uniref:GNAT family N-acetyltransferase n=1 Tax=Roseovarius sp. (strain 217) TaxID=314264 RepID=UPI0000686FBE|nr:GNAT family N-acetyltransferase [Roseovarius sp. 217]EAQ23611.1 acetyltransferase, GNAT family protein [Roseovarius sp. 217]
MRRYLPADDLNAVHALLCRTFAYMEGRIDPPSSLAHLDVDALRVLAATSEIWVISERSYPIACMILTPQPDALYLGKLAVDAGHRGQGLAGKMVAHAETRAITLGLPRLRLQTRLELVENHATFANLGFVITAQTAHPGYDRPTSLTMERLVPIPLEDAP